MYGCRFRRPARSAAIGRDKRPVPLVGHWLLPPLAWCSCQGYMEGIGVRMIDDEDVILG